MEFFCIADKDSSLGFKLSGIETLEAVTRQEALEALRVAGATDGVGVIIITSRVYAFIKEEADEISHKNQFPLILEIPSRGQTGKGKSAGDFLKELIGVSV
ncbi:MAG: V-type ATP synthase subunit F [Candidatus Omnitrophica bacterium]|nr:V-type ATP synthase subunit F [Candidatus Omnitrophota bacterium]